LTTLCSVYINFEKYSAGATKGRTETQIRGENQAGQGNKRRGKALEGIDERDSAENGL
jgi:hypothetical protein